MLFYFYYITNAINNKIYVGVTNDPEKRWKTHRNVAKGGKEKHPHHYQAVHQAIAKYGVDNFTFDIAKVFSNEDEAYLYEEDTISYMKNMNVLSYNIAGGGKGTGSGVNHPMFGKKLPQEWINNLAKALKETNNNPEIKEGHRQRMIARNWTGENHPMYGKTHSEETRKLISKAGKGRPISQEIKEKIGASNRGKIISKETKEKISKAMKSYDFSGDRNPNFGNKWTEEQRKSLSDKKTGMPNASSRALTKDQIIQIFLLRRDGISFYKIGKTFNCCKSIIMSIIHGIHYRNIIEELILQEIILPSEIIKSKPSKKLSDRDVLDIVKLCREESNYTELANKYNVSYGTIYAIMHGMTWSKITGIKKYNIL